MKQLLISIGLIALFSFQQPKRITLHESTIATVQQSIGQVYQYISSSNLPQQEARQLMQLLENANAAIVKDLQDSLLNKK